MNLPITLPVIVHDQASMQAEEMGMDTDFRDATVIDARFYTIDHVLSFPLEDENDYSVIFSGGQQVICPIPYEELLNMLEK